MSNHTIELDDLKDHLQLTDEGEDATWPEPRIELTVKWHPAEPDVGIFHNQPELTKVAYELDGEWFDQEAAFVAALYERISEFCTEGPDEIAGMIAARIENEDFGDGEC